MIVFNPDSNYDKKITASGEETKGGEISGWWRRGRVELPVQKKLPSIYYKLSQLFYLTWLTSADRV